jgi:hypothetical protein
LSEQEFVFRVTSYGPHAFFQPAKAMHFRSPDIVQYHMSCEKEKIIRKGLHLRQLLSFVPDPYEDILRELVQVAFPRLEQKDILSDGLVVGAVKGLKRCPVAGCDLHQQLWFVMYNAQGQGYSSKKSFILRKQETSFSAYAPLFSAPDHLF